ncbi:hypothetical protein H072_851 [Dactylellina haptotyla CBS 200.50]|uniref:Uncharacterized protein n=1 Tax=Dactylellina haptotyla (strain CBS 200.50) TaxID=1284197 RepID=S8AQM3_DACHA|nr:hypothetical protein H072_851 [Dactylellina haptotyla CBS 200.50]
MTGGQNTTPNTSGQVRPNGLLQPPSTASSTPAPANTRNSSVYPLKSILPGARTQPDTFFIRWRQVIISAVVFLFLLCGTIGIVVGIFEFKRQLLHKEQATTSTSSQPAYQTWDIESPAHTSLVPPMPKLMHR